MTNAEILQRAQQLAAQIKQESDKNRLSFRSEFSSLLSELRAAGVGIPRVLQQLDIELCEEAAELQFDNMPV